MKKILFTLILAFTGMIGFSQADSTKAPYLKFPTYPPVKLLMTDSTTFFTRESLDKKTPVMVMFFDPGCDHCKHETEDLVKNMDQLKDVQIVMTTYKPLTEIREFVSHFGLNKFSNIVVAQDYGFFLPSFYNITYFPFLAFYNKKKELIDVFQGPMPMEKLVETIHK